MSASAQEIRRTLDATLISVKSKHESCTVAAKKLVRAYSILLRAEETREVKGNPRAMSAYVRAESAFKLAKREYYSAYKHYEELLAEAMRLYSELIDIEESHRIAKKLTAEMTRFESRADANKEALKRRIFEAAISLDDEPREEVPKAPRVEEKPKESTSEPAFREERRDAYAPPYSYYGGAYPPQVAPASIDISGIVEDAVRTAMGKFLSVFEKRMDEYEAALDEIRLPEVAPSAAPTDEAEKTSAKEESLVPEMEMAIAYEEERILEKLGEIVERLKTVSESLTALGASAIETAGAQAAAAEEQKRANDMQRRTARDIQGVLVNQKLISGEAAELAGAQAAAIEEQKANIENQKLIGASQAEIAEMEKSIIEASAALGESVKELMSSQRSLISQQSSLINANAKNVDSQRELTERQAEVTAMQRTAEKEHRALTREPRRRPRSKADGESEKATVTEAAEELIEESASAETVTEAVAIEASAETVRESTVTESAEDTATEEAPVTAEAITASDTTEASAESAENAAAEEAPVTAKAITASDAPEASAESAEDTAAVEAPVTAEAITASDTPEAPIESAEDAAAEESPVTATESDESAKEGNAVPENAPKAEDDTATVPEKVDLNSIKNEE